jgi:hypothetical protein
MLERPAQLHADCIVTFVFDTHPFLVAMSCQLTPLSTCRGALELPVPQGKPNWQACKPAEMADRVGMSGRPWEFLQLLRSNVGLVVLHRQHV